jgi:ABC-type antimicrobial peptide transport system, ATPase component
MGETYDMVKALDGVDLSVEEGEFVAIVGKSGSRKSTLLHMLGGLDTLTEGEIIIDSKNISKMSRDEMTIFRLRKIGFVFRNYNLLPFINVYENITLPIRLDGLKPDKSFLEDILKMLGMEKKEYAMPNQLSGGQQ